MFPLIYFWKITKRFLNNKIREILLLLERISEKNPRTSFNITELVLRTAKIEKLSKVTFSETVPSVNLCEQLYTKANASVKPSIPICLNDTS